MTCALTEHLVDLIARLHPGGAYGLVDYPLYNNPGDAAIWAGTRRVLERAIGKPPAYVATLRGFDAAQAKATLTNGAVYFLGGGNFGALYARHHRMRLQAIAALHGVPVICLPFSVAGLTHDAALLETTASTLESHNGVTLIAREANTRHALRQYLGHDAHLAPDAAHALALSAAEPRCEKVLLMRRDTERIAAPSSVADPTLKNCLDWGDMPELRRINRLGKVAASLSPRILRCWTYDTLADLRVAAAVKRIAAGRTIETDRLHGALLGAIIGRDVIAHDTATGKIAAYLETWSPNLPTIIRQAS